MALQKIKQSAYGVDFEYHKISSIDFKEGRTTIVGVDSFLNRSARNSGKEPIETNFYAVDLGNKANLIGAAYIELQISRKNIKIITPEVSEVVTPAVMDGINTITPAVINIITPAVVEETETNFFADAVEI